MLISALSHILLVILFFMQNTNSQNCPEWVTSMLEETLAKYSTWPGIQLTLSSPHCGLNCTTSVHSNASEFASEPALLDNTPWRLASVTKTFTAVALLKLAQQNQLDLDAPAGLYLPHWAINLLVESQGTEYAGRITTSHLLHHTSGLGNFANDPRWMKELLDSPQHTWTQCSLIKWSTANSTPVGYPGEKFHYSDTGYTYLGLILEHITETDLAAAVRKLTDLDELDMPSTWWELLEPEPKDALERAGQYYGTVDSTHFNPTFDLFAAGGLVTNSRDLNRFGRALYEGRILDQERMKLLYTLESSGTYGCGILNYSLAGQEAWGHTGFWNTWLYWVPSLDLVISGASNQADSKPFDVGDLVQRIIDHGCVPMDVASHVLRLDDREKLLVDTDNPSKPREEAAQKHLAAD